MRRVVMIIIAVLLILGGCSSHPYSCKDCNVVFIIIDDFRANHASLYGYYRNTTPFLNALADNAVVFDNAFVQGTYTFTSVPSMLTSQMPFSLYGLKKDIPIPSNVVTLAQVMKNNGYKTVAFTGGIYFSKEFGLDRGFEVWNESGFLLFRNYRMAEAWLNKNMGSRFFMVLHGMELHDPVNKGHVHFAKDISRINGSEGEWGRLEKEYFQTGKMNLTKAEIAEYTAMYDDDIRWVDNSTRQFFKYLKEKGLLKNTIVVITADHGEEFLDHGGIQHGYTLYDEVLRVPLLIRFPTGVGLRHSGNARLIDLVPTLLDSVGIKTDLDFQGVSLLPIMNSREDLVVYSETNRGGLWRSIIEGDWKLIVNKGTRELYNISEKHNLCNKTPKRCEEMASRLSNYFEGLPHLWEQKDSNLSEQMKERLRRMGYLK